ncbi:hypothetical protein [uncultured Gilliamella sp.]|uniref:phage tail protein n=1 Tax=uncultured Gilliamella sp. TaxID=1193505 RepID=UPI0025CE74F5|nr:hypothetical protein [uncultured Gilliamella sp.]
MCKKFKKKPKTKNNSSRANSKNKPQSNARSSEIIELKKINEQANSNIVNKISDNQEKRISKSKEIKEVGINIVKPVLKTVENTVNYSIELELAMNKVARQVKSLRDLQGKPAKLFNNMKAQIQSLSQQISPSKGTLGIAEQVESNAKLDITKQSGPISEQHKQLQNLTGISAMSTNNLPLLNQQQSLINNPNTFNSSQIKADIDCKSLISQFELLSATLAYSLNSVGGIIQGLIALLTELTANTQQWINNFLKFINTFNEIISIISSVKTILDEQGNDPIKNLTNSFGELENVLTIFDEIISITSSVKTILDELGINSITTLINSFKGLGNVLTKVGQFLKGPTGLAFMAIAAVIVVVALLIRKYWEPISAFFIGFWEGLINEIQPLIDIFMDIFSFLGPIFTAIGNAIGEVINWFSELLSPIKLTNEQFESCKSAGVSFGSVIGKIFMSRFNLLINLFKTLKEKIGDAWDLIMSLPDKIAVIPSKIKEFFTGENGLLTMFINFGGDIVEGLVNGLKKRCNELKDSILELGSNVCSWFKSKLGINSPSKVFKEFGINTISGYQLGIDRTQGSVLDSMSKFADKVTKNAPQMPLNTMNNRTNTVANSGNSNIQEGISQYYITINAAPGMNEQEIARVITQELDRREQQKLFQIRSSLRDIY